MTPESGEDRSEEGPLGFVAVSTPRFRESIARQQATLSSEEFSAFILAIRSVFETYSAKLSAYEPGVERGTALHKIMDETTKTAAHVKVSCCKGCSGCCHYEVEITNDEAVVLASIVRGGLAIDASQLSNQAARERRAPAWSDVLHPSNRCVFLGEDNACRVYESRPSVCRRMLVTSPAEACSKPGQPVTPVEILLAEILLSAALSLAGSSFGSLSKMLLASLPAA